MAGGVEFVDDVAVGVLAGGARFAGPAALVEGGGGGLEHTVGVLQQQRGVPAQEEVAILCVPAASLAHKEARLPRRAVVVAAVVRAVVAPAHRHTQHGSTTLQETPALSIS